MTTSSSIFKNTISTPDAAIQGFRPMLEGRVKAGMEALYQLVKYCEGVTTIGATVGIGGGSIHLSPDDLRAHLDEFDELELFAVLGRDLMQKMGYVNPRENQASGPVPPMEPMKVTGDAAHMVQPITMQFGDGPAAHGVQFVPIPPVFPEKLAPESPPVVTVKKPRKPKIPAKKKGEMYDD